MAEPERGLRKYYFANHPCSFCPHLAPQLVMMLYLRGRLSFHSVGFRWPFLNEIIKVIQVL